MPRAQWTEAETQGVLRAQWTEAETREVLRVQQAEAEIPEAIRKERREAGIQEADRRARQEAEMLEAAPEKTEMRKTCPEAEIQQTVPAGLREAEAKAVRTEPPFRKYSI